MWGFSGHKIQQQQFYSTHSTVYLQYVKYRSYTHSQSYRLTFRKWNVTPAACVLLCFFLLWQCSAISRGCFHRKWLWHWWQWLSFSFQSSQNSHLVKVLFQIGHFHSYKSCQGMLQTIGTETYADNWCLRVTQISRHQIWIKTPREVFQKKRICRLTGLVLTDSEGKSSMLSS